MKKNKMMRMAAVLLVAVLATTCALSGSFAKYVGEGETSDEARVAAFGIEVAASTGSMFETEYSLDEEAGSLTIGVSADEEVVAPGTTGTILSADLSGVAEVATKVSAKEVSVAFDGWEVDGEWYCPIVITIGEDEYCGNDYTDEDAFNEALEDAIEEDISAYIGVGDEAGTVVNNFGSITWSWPFEDGEGQIDASDTALGQAAYEAINDDQVGTTAPTVEISLDIVVEQID